jgi:aspartyl protease family protein
MPLHLYLPRFIAIGVMLCTGSLALSGTDTQFEDRAFAAEAATAQAPRAVASTAIRASAPLRINRAADGLFYIIGHVNGQAVRFLIDTGANIVVLTPNDARRLGIGAGSPNGAASSIETATGQSQMKRVVLDHVAVGGHSLENVDAAVLGNGLKVSLLGQNMLAELGPVTFSRDAVVF